MNSDYFVSRDGSSVPVLLILDRNEDPITPLLTQWTYQAMIHEFFVIKNGRVKMETPNLITEYVMNFDNDNFYGEQMFSPIWTVAESVQSLVNRYQKLTLQSTNFSSIADMKKFMQDYPEYKRLSQHVNKHVTLASELMKISDKINLRTISQFEQDLVNINESAENVWSRLRVFLKDPQVSHYHKLRLCMVVLCHVGIHQPLDHLSTFGFSDDDISVRFKIIYKSLTICLYIHTYMVVLEILLFN
jgi:vacuolar protein sorting-associated protein 45